jgi:hypothetical protein
VGAHLAVELGTVAGVLAADGVVFAAFIERAQVLLHEVEAVGDLFAGDLVTPEVIDAVVQVLFGPFDIAFVGFLQGLVDRLSGALRCDEWDDVLVHLHVCGVLHGLDADGLFLAAAGDFRLSDLVPEDLQFEQLFAFETGDGLAF